ncbi:TauD/TfdA family dioxygenase [Streptomyces sp. NPDC005529]|uniref:TauD/TfdA family dioxygenase n=1 Tax=unclassified Streptomyces TaxID=2593676 RepID=UPI0033B6D213
MAGAGGVISLPDELGAALVELAGALPDWEREGTFVAASSLDRYREHLSAAPGFDEAVESLRQKLDGPGGGYAVVRLGNVADALGFTDHFLRLATAILSQVAVPFQPFLRWPLWKEIGTNLNANPGLSTGTGYNAFHMDLVNASRPPDYTSLLCVRPDPLGGGPSILSDARAAVERLTPSSRTLLADEAYRYGSFTDLADVGEEFTPFAVLDDQPADAGFVRFTAKMLGASRLDEDHAQAARELADQLIAGQVSFTLQRGDFLIVNQHRFVHGRQSLGPGQQDVHPEARRLLLQLFSRSTDGTTPA